MAETLRELFLSCQRVVVINLSGATLVYTDLKGSRGGKCKKKKNRKKKEHAKDNISGSSNGNHMEVGIRENTLPLSLLLHHECNSREYLHFS